MIERERVHWKPTLKLFIKLNVKILNVKTIRTYKYRICPSRKQEANLQLSLLESGELWNSLLEYVKEYHKTTGKFPSRYALIKLTKGKSTKLYSQTAQNTADRLYKAIKRTFVLRRRGLKAGFPRFRPPERIKSIAYPQFGFRLEDKLALSKIGRIQIRKHREINGKIKTLSIKRMPSGKWYALFAVETKVTAPTIQCPKTSVGMDLGITYFAYLSDGGIIENPRHFRKAENKLKRTHRTLSKKRKGSRNRKKAKLKVARAHEKVANSRRDFLHKSSHMLVNSYSLVAMENFETQKMSRGFLAKSILDCSWAEFARMLAYKAEEAGCEIVLVNPARTTQECSQCGSVKKKSLAERWHSCACGASMHRDLNAAMNILNRSCKSNCKRSERSSLRATAGTAGSQACEKEASTLSANGASIFNEAGNLAL